MCTTLSLVAALIAGGCSAPLTSVALPSNRPGPPAPLADRPVRLALVGQSNPNLGRPVFAERTDILTLIPTNANGPVIACWDSIPAAPPIGQCWPSLVESITRVPMDAFVFWQGESDIDNPHYGAQLADFVGRVRFAVGDPRLLIVLMQYGPAYAGHPNGSELQSQAWVAQDAHAIWVPTRDLEFEPDGGHMTPAGYAAAAQRIVSLVRASWLSRAPLVGRQTPGHFGVRALQAFHGTGTAMPVVGSQWPKSRA